MNSKDEFVRKMHSKLDIWSAEIDVLAAKANQAKAEMRAEYEGQITALKAKQAAARANMTELQQAGDTAWEDLKSGMETAWGSLEQAVASAKSRFK